MRNLVVSSIDSFHCVQRRTGTVLSIHPVQRRTPKRRAEFTCCASVDFPAIFVASTAFTSTSTPEVDVTVTFFMPPMKAFLWVRRSNDDPT
jgi:hypothetical protein